MATTMKKPAQLSPAFEDLWGDEPQSELQTESQADAQEEVTAATDATDPGDLEEQENGQDADEVEPTEDADESAIDPDETKTIDDRAEEQAAEQEAEPVNQVIDGVVVHVVSGEEFKAEFPPATEIAITPEQQAEIDFDRRKKEAEEQFIELAIDRARLEVALKTAKKLEKDALEELSDLIDQGPQRPISRPTSPPPQRQESQPATTEATDVAPDSGEITSTAPATESENTAWREASVTQLGLKPSLETLLIETHSIATIGQLVDLQTKIGDRREDWPKGIGEAKITQIEDAMTTWLSRNRDRVNDSRNVPVTVVDETTSQESEEPETGHADIDAANEEWEAMTTEQQCEWLNARCVQVDSDVLDDLDLRGTDSEEQWQEGVEAYDSDDQAHNCPYGPGVDCDAWLQGWLWQGRQDTSEAGASESEGEG